MGSRHRLFLPAGRVVAGVVFPAPVEAGDEVWVEGGVYGVRRVMHTLGSKGGPAVRIVEAWLVPSERGGVAEEGSLLDPVEELFGGDSQRAGEAGDGVEAGVAPGSFEKADLGSVQRSSRAEAFLGKLLAFAFAAEVRCELLARLHSWIVRLLTTIRLQTKHLTMDRITRRNR